MTLSLMLWILPFVVALMLLLLTSHQQKLWQMRHAFGEATSGLLIASLLFLGATPFAGPTIIFLGTLQLWALLLAIRLLFGRLDEAFMRSSTWQNTLIAMGLLAIVLAGHELVGVMFSLQDYSWRTNIGLALSAALAFVLLGHLMWSMKHYKLRNLSTALTRKQLPTVSVCIPARNEDQALMECLTSVLGSDYPKMEVIVLDDCSQDATSQIVRSFAHDGVRFIQGDIPAGGWLGKNQAMQSLAEHAVGDLLLFLSVDTRLEKQSIALLANYMASNDLEMMTVLPQNRLGMERATLFSSLQYFWQVVLPITKRRVPVSSKCWLISAKKLKELGGFASVKHKIIPEGSFARRLFSANAYRFIISNSQLGITTAKLWRNQIDTSVRILYPTVKRQPLYVFGALLLCLLFVLPFAVVAWQCIVLTSAGQLFAGALVSVLLLIVYASVLIRTQPHAWWLSMWLFPFVMLQEALLMLVSMLQYEFGSVDWKGRNVCYPVITNGRISSAPR